MCGIRVVHGRYTVVYGGHGGTRMVYGWYTDGIRWYTAGLLAWYTDGIRTVYGGIRVASCNFLIFVVKKVRVMQDWGTCIASTLGVT